MFKLELKTSNAAFEEEPGLEVAAILDNVGERLGNGETSGIVRDVNGNTIGSFTLTADDELTDD